MAKNKDGLDWRGDDVFDAVLKAAQYGIDETLAKCVDDAKENVPVVTATLQGSIRIEPARILRRRTVVGSFGSFDVNYALAVETGDRSLVAPSTDQTRERLPRQGAGKNTGNKHFLRNAADREFPKLTGRIKRNLK